MDFFKKIKREASKKHSDVIPPTAIVGDVYRLAYDFIVGKFRISEKGTVTYDHKDAYSESDRKIISNWATFFSVGKSVLLYGSLMATILESLEKDEKDGTYGELSVKDKVDFRLGFLEKYAEFRSEGFQVFGVKGISEVMESLIRILDEHFTPYSKEELKYAVLALPSILIVDADDKEQGVATPFRIRTYTEFSEFCEKKKLVEYAPDLFVPMLKELSKSVHSAEKKASSKNDSKRKDLLKKIHESAEKELGKADGLKKEAAISEAFSHFSENREAILSALKEDVVGQDRQIDGIFPFVGKTYVGMNRRPASFLFLGPSGVGKTRLGKMVAKRFGGGQPCIINLGNFHNSSSMATILGAPPGYVSSGNETVLEKYLNSINNDERLTAQLPVIIFDEFEKADPSIQNLLLEMLDLGTVTLMSGTVLDVSRSVIILTSNLGAAKKRIGFESSDDELEKIRMNEEEMVRESEKFLKKEILNRLDKTIVFNELSKDDYARIRKNVIRDYVKETFETNVPLMKAVSERGLSLESLAKSASETLEGKLKSYGENEELEGEDNLRLFEKLVENEIYETVLAKLSEHG